MTTSSTPGTEPLGKGGRELEDDQDLLTYGEVNARVAEVIAEEEQRLGELQAEGALAERLAEVRGRIEVLREAGARNARGASDQTFEAQFGYVARRVRLPGSDAGD